MNSKLMVAWLGLGLLSTACGGSAEPAEAPPAPAQEDNPAIEAAEPQLGEASADEAEPPTAESAPAEEESEPVDKFTFQAAMQAVLSDYALIEALHLDKPGRIPLAIAGDIPEGIALYAEERAVKVVPVPEDPKKEPVLVFLKIELDSKSGRFRYRYEAEGIAGTSRVAPGDGKWVLKSSRIQPVSR